MTNASLSAKLSTGVTVKSAPAPTCVCEPGSAASFVWVVSLAVSPDVLVGLLSSDLDFRGENIGPFSHAQFPISMPKFIRGAVKKPLFSSFLVAVASALVSATESCSSFLSSGDGLEALSVAVSSAIFMSRRSRAVGSIEVGGRCARIFDSVNATKVNPVGKMLSNRLKMVCNSLI